MEELKRILEIRSSMIDEIGLLIFKKKILKSEIQKELGLTNPKLRRVLDNEVINDELLSKVLEFCRNYKQEEK